MITDRDSQSGVTQYDTVINTGHNASSWDKSKTTTISNIIHFAAFFVLIV